MLSTTVKWSPVEAGQAHRRKKSLPGVTQARHDCSQGQQPITICTEVSMLTTNTPLSEKDLDVFIYCCILSV